MSKEIYYYLDDLLLLQSKVADKYNHKGILGAVREIFLKRLLEERLDNIIIHTGEITVANKDIGQQDLIVRKQGTINPELGGHVRLPAKDCSAIIEVKSNAKGTDIRNFDNKATMIKAENPDTTCGLVCYKLQCRKETILNRAGFDFDKDVDGFIRSENNDPEYSSLDFILCLDETEENKDGTYYLKAFFLKQEQQYELFLKPPYTEYFLLEINRLVT